MIHNGVLMMVVATDLLSAFNVGILRDDDRFLAAREADGDVFARIIADGSFFSPSLIRCINNKSSQLI